MDIGIFCVVCGGPFDINGDIYHIDSQDERFRVSQKLGLSTFLVLCSQTYLLSGFSTFAYLGLHPM